RPNRNAAPQPQRRAPTATPRPNRNAAPQPRRRAPTATPRPDRDAAPKPRRCAQAATAPGRVVRFGVCTPTQLQAGAVLPPTHRRQGHRPAASPRPATACCASSHLFAADNPRVLTLRCMATIGLIGAGNIGSQLARLAIAAGHDVVLSNSRGPETLSTLVAELGERARAATPEEAAKAGDLVVVTIPLKNYRSVPVEPLAGKIVIDTMNYYPQRDGNIAELDQERTTTSELLQAHLPKSKVVKAFNHIYAAELTQHGQPAGSKD